MAGKEAFLNVMQGAKAGGSLIGDLFGGFVVNPIQEKKRRQLQERLAQQQIAEQKRQFDVSSDMSERQTDMQGMGLLAELRQRAIAERRGKVFNDMFMKTYGG
jgi:hypothetical protein